MIQVYRQVFKNNPVLGFLNYWLSLYIHTIDSELTRKVILLLGHRSQGNFVSWIASFIVPCHYCAHWVCMTLTAVLPFLLLLAETSTPHLTLFRTGISTLILSSTLFFISFYSMSKILFLFCLSLSLVCNSNEGKDFCHLISVL